MRCLIKLYQLKLTANKKIHKNNNILCTKNQDKHFLLQMPFTLFRTTKKIIANFNKLLKRIFMLFVTLLMLLNLPQHESLLKFYLNKIIVRNKM